MKCNNCPLYHYINSETEKSEYCDVFGDGWDNQFLQQKDKTIVGCYLERNFILKYAHLLKERTSFLRDIEKMPTTELTDCSF